MASASDIYVKLQKLSNQATKTTLKYNKEEASTARSWQTKMSNTAHQREVNDLIKAGLNPVLSANSGAQSYTTSAASAQAENAANAVANAYGADQSAAATRYAANQSAAAMRASAAAQLQAAKVAAAAQMYNTDKNYDIQQKRIEADKWIAQHKQPSSIVGLADKYIGQYLSKKAIKDITNIGDKFSKNDFNNSKGAITKDNFILNRNGQKKANQGLFKLGLTQSRYNRELWIKAFIFGDNNAWSQIAKQCAANKRAAKNASSIWYRGSHGVW